MSLPHHAPLKHKRTTLERAEKFISKAYFADVNLQSKIYCEKKTLQDIKHYAAPGRVSYEQAIQGNYTPTTVGNSFGPVWSTHWFEIDITVPDSWVGKEVHFLWNSGSEALVWINGEPRQGLNEMDEKNYYILSDKLNKKGFRLKLYVEMACNALFGVGGMTHYNKDDESKTYTLRQAEIAVFDREAFDLIQDIESLHDIAKEFGEEQRGYQALYTVNRILNYLSARDWSKWPECRSLAAEFFNQTNGQSQHTVYAMGHAHIDSAWLWPYAETIRKCARSWSCSIRLMEKYPDFKFCCSQAQQYQWVKEHYPALWKDVCRFVSKGQFVPVGGTWVEMDGNIPSGEACIRQFLYGQKFFREEFGIQCKEFWLPDTFGYSGQFPQILRHCGVTRFLSQKLSWSLVNKFPHNTFLWEGIDGSTVLSHFPSGDSYEMSGRVKELRKSVNNFRDKGRSNRSAFLFGHGDGGHGPSEEMLGRLFRFKDCDGLPKVKFSGSDEFFDSIEKEGTDMLCRWRGELYLELHNGTYTTWAQVKKCNRQSEVLLQAIEALSTIACLRNKEFRYPYGELERLWKLLLLNQFHDVLPGSSISQVFTDAIEYYKDIDSLGQKLLQSALTASVTGSQKTDTTTKGGLYVMNVQGFEMLTVCTLPPLDSKSREPAEPAAKMRRRNSVNDAEYVLLKVPPLCTKPIEDCIVKEALPVKCIRQGANFILQNEWISAEVDPLGRVLSLRCVDAKDKEGVCGTLGREAIASAYPANQFVLYDDIPLFWDAWDVMDYHLETRQPLCNASQRVKVEEESPMRVTLSVSIQISEESCIKQRIILASASPLLRFETEVVWKENRRFLKVEFPTSIHATEVTYDIQSGYIQRPNHFNTSWDSAKFEVCGHKWADISEHGFGVSVLNDCKYGYSAVDGVIRLSLLRSPKGPDPNADMGTHTFAYALMPHVGTFQDAGVIQQAVSFNSGLRILHAEGTHCAQSASCGPYASSYPLFRSITPQVFVQTVKMSEDQKSAVILRLNEAFGGRTRAEIWSSQQFSAVQISNGLEDVVENEEEEKSLELKTERIDTGLKISASLKPFQIVTLRCCL